MALAIMQYMLTVRLNQPEPFSIVVIQLDEGSIPSWASIFSEFLYSLNVFLPYHLSVAHLIVFRVMNNI